MGPAGRETIRDVWVDRDLNRCCLDRPWTGCTVFQLATPNHIKSEDAPAPPGFQAPVFTSNVATERKELGIAEALYYQMMGNESDVTMLFTAPVYDTETPEAPKDSIEGSRGTRAVSKG